MTTDPVRNTAQPIANCSAIHYNEHMTTDQENSEMTRCPGGAGHESCAYTGTLWHPSEGKAKPATTYRERREAKAERLRGWAAKRDVQADAVFDHNRPITSDWAFITQPGHIPQRARIIAQEDRAYASKAKAASMRSRADNIEAAAANAIYSDDPDAIEALTAKIARLEAERARIKAYNASCRKGARDLSILTEREQADLLSTARVCPYQIGKNGEMPRYKLTNLGGTINAARKRLAALQSVVESATMKL